MTIVPKSGYGWTTQIGSLLRCGGNGESLI